MHVIAGLEIRVLSALGDLFIDARWTFLFASSATVPACLDLTRGRGPARSPARGLVWPASPQRRGAKPSKRR